MATQNIPVTSAQTTTNSSMSITAAYSASGDSVSWTTATSAVRLICGPLWAIEYQVGSGSFARLDPGKSTDLEIDMSTTTLKLRRAQFTGNTTTPSPASASFVFYGVPSGLNVDSDPGSSSSVSGDGNALALGWRNRSLSNTAKIRQIIGGGISQTARGRLLMLGNSLIYGTGSVASGLNGASAGLPKQLQKLLTGSICNWFVGDGGSGSVGNFLNADSRVTQSGTITRYVNGGLGGDDFQHAVNATTTLTPGGTFDTVDLLYMGSSGNGSFQVSIDGGVTPLGTVSTNHAQNIYLSSVAVTAGSTAATIKAVTAGAYLVGMGVRTSTTPGIEIVNAGYGGSVIADYQSAANFKFQQAATALMDSNATNATVFSCTINDAVAGTAMATYTSNLTTTLAFLQTLGDVIYCVEPRPSSGAVSASTYDTYAEAAIAVAVALNIPVLDMRSVQNYLSAIWYDTKHPRAQVYGMWASSLVAGLR
jgi:hypothetical protein